MFNMAPKGVAILAGLESHQRGFKAAAIGSKLAPLSGIGRSTSFLPMHCAGLIALCCFLWSATSLAADQVSVHDVPTRPGVTVPVLLIKPERPVATILLFPGGTGRVTFQPDGSTGYRGFPVRKPQLFAQEGFMVAVINAASDTPPRHFLRDAATHVEDIRHVITFLRKAADIPVWLVGHSAGSTSVAGAAIQIPDAGFVGIVLISSENGKPDLRSGNLDKLSIEAITMPTLVAHHEQDQCEYTRFANAQRLMGRLKKSVKSELISFKGGGPVEGNPCGSLHYHGFPGIEQEVASRIAGWIKTGAAPGPKIP